MTMKQKSVLMSTLLLMLCLALVAAGTYALFTDEVTLTNHLEAGHMDITLKRIKLETLTLDTASGFLVEKNDDTVEDFSNGTDKNIFGLDESAVIVPGCTYTATMQLMGVDKDNPDRVNNVAFSYWLEIKFDGNKSNGELADQLTVIVTTKDGTEHEVVLREGKFIGGEASPIGTVKLNRPEDDPETFKVTVIFDDLNTNNDAQGDNVTFDLIVHAVQATKKPTTTGSGSGSGTTTP